MHAIKGEFAQHISLQLRRTIVSQLFERPNTRALITDIRICFYMKILHMLIDCFNYCENNPTICNCLECPLSHIGWIICSIAMHVKNETTPEQNEIRIRI